MASLLLYKKSSFVFLSSAIVRPEELFFFFHRKNRKTKSIKISYERKKDLHKITVKHYLCRKNKTTLMYYCTTTYKEERGTDENLFFSMEKTIEERGISDFLYVMGTHLGNVQVVVSDRKIPIDNNSDGIIDYYTADVRSAQDYYPGGMMMPGRNFSAPIYKFGYQGQIKTDEVYGSGNLYSYEFRESDPRLGGQFWSIDPLAPKYAGWSPYAFSQRRYIDGRELEGLEYISTNDQNISSTQDVGGTTTLTIGESSYPSSGIVNYNGQDYYNLGQNISGADGQKLTTFFVTSGQLQNIFPNASQSNINGVAGALNQNMGNYGIDTYKGLSQFLGQVGQETGGLTTFSENLNYSFNNLCNNFADDFSEVDNNTGAYVNNPQNWGNLIYGGRTDLGNTGVSSGDGYNFKGRGLLQLTGRSNYTSFNNFYNKKYGSGPNFLTNADLVATNISYATISGLWYFNSRVANKLNLNNASVSQITKLVTGKSTQGLIGRTKYYNTSIDVLH